MILKKIIVLALTLFPLCHTIAQDNSYYFIYDFVDREAENLKMGEYHEWSTEDHFSMVFDSSLADRKQMVERDNRGLVTDISTTYSAKSLNSNMPMYKNLKHNTIIRTVISPEGILSQPKTETIAEELYSFNWELTGEKKQIDSLLCYKATTNFRCQTYEVWYAPEIPISSGPHFFHGLPGLIIEAKLGDQDRKSYRLRKMGVLKSPKLNKEKLGFVNLDTNGLPDHCDLEEKFTNYVRVLMAKAGDPDCLNCETIINSVNWSECWDECE